MKNEVYNFIKRLNQNLDLISRKIKRLFVSNVIAPPDFKNIPIIINNRNRFTFLKQLIEWLEINGYKNIYIIDNDSSYPPLLDYYKTTPHKIFYLKKNVGYKSIWLTHVFKNFEKSYYVYTDPDVIPGKDCPDNIVEELYKLLIKFPGIEKAGPALKINDIPDNYAHKKEVLRIEDEWWKKKIENDVFDAPIDTTFALYRPFAWGIAEECKAYRLGGKYEFKHQPWYENSATPSEEDIYYKNSVSKESSYWLNFK